MTSVSLSPELIREKAEARKEPAWLTEARLQAFATYEKLEAPVYRRTDLRGFDLPALATKAFVQAKPARETHAKTQDGVVRMPLAQAAHEHEDLVRPYLAAGLDAAATKWDALQAAIWTQGTFLHVDKKVEVADALHAATKLPAEGGVIRDLVALEPLSKANLVDRWTGGTASGQALGLANLEMHLKDGANLHISLLQETERATTLIQQRRAHLARDSRLEWIDGQFGGAKSVTTNLSLLEGEGSKVKFVGAFFGGQDQHFDITTSALHRNKHTESQLDMKGALTENGYAANYSIVFVAENAPSSSGHQHQETLILGPGARADAIPKLDVENNDVSASHGATVGQVDPEQIFYLRSRGLTELQARRTIVEGFFEPLLREIPFDDIREEIGGALVTRLK